MAKYPPLQSNSHILIVDDYDTMRRIIRALLSQLGYTNYHEARDAIGALYDMERFKKFSFMICDSVLDSAAGINSCLDLLRMVRANANPVINSIPILVVRSHEQEALEPAFLAAGANAMIVKPYNATTLAEKIATIFG